MPSGFLWCLRSSFDLDKEVDENVGVLLDEYELEQSNPELNELLQSENMSNSDDEKRQLLKYLSLLNKERKEFREQVIRLTQKLFLMEKSALLGINWKELGSIEPLNTLKKRFRVNSEIQSRFNSLREAKLEELQKCKGELVMFKSAPEYGEAVAGLVMAKKTIQRLKQEKEKAIQDANNQRNANEKLKRGLQAMALADPNSVFNNSQCLSEENIRKMSLRNGNGNNTPSTVSRTIGHNADTFSNLLYKGGNQRNSDVGINLYVNTCREPLKTLEELEISKSTFPLTS
jgi:hypothetical protein